MSRAPARKPTVTTMSQTACYLRQAEKCERQAAAAKLQSSRQDFLYAAVQWRNVAAKAGQREAREQHPTHETRRAVRPLGALLDVLRRSGLGRLWQGSPRRGASGQTGATDRITGPKGLSRKLRLVK